MAGRPSTSSADSLDLLPDAMFNTFGRLVSTAIALAVICARLNAQSASAFPHLSAAPSSD